MTTDYNTICRTIEHAYKRVEIENTDLKREIRQLRRQMQAERLIWRQIFAQMARAAAETYYERAA